MLPIYCSRTFRESGKIRFLNASNFSLIVNRPSPLTWNLKSLTLG